MDSSIKTLHNNSKKTIHNVLASDYSAFNSFDPKEYPKVIILAYSKSEVLLMLHYIMPSDFSSHVEKIVEISPHMTSTYLTESNGTDHYQKQSLQK